MIKLVCSGRRQRIPYDAIRPQQDAARLICPEGGCTLPIKAALGNGRNDWLIIKLRHRRLRTQPGESRTKEIEARDATGGGVDPKVREPTLYSATT